MLGNVHIDFTVGKNCWNFLDSYGEICIGCGCCSKDKKTRYKSRILCLERWLDERINFDGWIEGCRELQEKNIKADIKYYKRKLRYYRTKLKEVNRDA